MPPPNATPEDMAELQAKACAATSLSVAGFRVQGIKGTVKGYSSMTLPVEFTPRVAGELVEYADLLFFGSVLGGFRVQEAAPRCRAASALRRITALWFCPWGSHHAWQVSLSLPAALKYATIKPQVGWRVASGCNGRLQGATGGRAGSRLQDSNAAVKGYSHISNDVKRLFCCVPCR